MTYYGCLTPPPPCLHVGPKEGNEIREIKLPIISPGQDKIGIIQSYKLLESPFKILEDPMYVESGGLTTTVI